MYPINPNIQGMWKHDDAIEAPFFLFFQKGSSLTGKSLVSKTGVMHMLHPLIAHHH